VTDAEQLVRTDAEREALAALRRATGQSDGPMERHGLRTFLIADRLATARDLEVDRELLLIAGLIHDIGIYDAFSSGGVYVHDGAEFATEMLQGRGWEEARIRLCADAIERHHELRSQWERGAEVELIRRADLIEVLAGRVRFGLSREWLEDLFRSVPRTGFYRELGRLIRHTLRKRPLTLPQIFIR
jgi:HD domain